MRNQRFGLLALGIPLLLIGFTLLFFAFESTKEVQAAPAADEVVYLPLVHKQIPTVTPTPTNTPIPTPTPGARPPIRRDECSSQGNYVRTSKLWPNGTTAAEVQGFYRMHPGDARFYTFFPNGVVNVYDGTYDPHTRLCIPAEYNNAWAQPGDPQFNETLYIEFLDGRPDWLGLTEDGAMSLTASSVISDSYVILGFAITGDSWFGSPVVGTIKTAEGAWGKVVRLVPGSQAMRLAGRTLGYVPALALLYQRIDKATSEGLTVGATELLEGAAVYHLARAVTTGYFQCYENAGAVADQLNTNAKKMYTWNTGTAGCIISGVPLAGNGGDIPYSWEVLLYAGVEAVRQGREVAVLTADDAKEIADAVEEFYNRDENDEPRRVPDDPNDTSCGAIDVEEVWQNAVEDVMAYSDDVIIHSEDVDFINQVSEFSYAVRFRSSQVTLQDRYALPGAQLSGYNAHATSQLNSPDEEGTHWNFEVKCWVFPVNMLNIHAWKLNRGYGDYDSRSGVATSNFPDRFNPPYPHDSQDLP